METTLVKTIEINGVVAVPESVDADRFTGEFLAWLKSKGWVFGGGIGPYDDNNELPR